MKKILVTGGAGYIGSHTVVELAQAGYTPVIVDNFCNSQKFIIDRLRKITGSSIKVYAGDCTDAAFVHKVFLKEKDIEGVIHFAALKSVQESVAKPLEYYRNNLGAMAVILEAMKAHQIPFFVFSSSCTVYGQPDRLPVRETTPLKEAQSPYGNTKKISEQILKNAIQSGTPFKAISLRYFNPIGAHPSGSIGELPLGTPQNLVPYLTQAASGMLKKLTVFGNDYDTSDGTCVRDYIHVVDLARAHVRALAYLSGIKKNSSYDVFNVGIGHGYSVLEVLHAFEKVTGVKVPYTIGPRRDGDIEKIYANVDKARKVLTWKAKMTLEDALKHAWAWQKNISTRGKR